MIGHLGLHLAESVVVDLFDATGRHISTLQNGNLPAARHVFTAKDLMPGLYFWRACAAGVMHGERLAILK